MCDILDCGVYLFTNTVNHKNYVGSSKDLPDREGDHRSRLNRGLHANPHFQAAWNKYGSGAFTYSVLEYCAEEDRWEREDWWMALLDSLNPARGYNKRTAERQIFSLETRARMSAALTGDKNPQYGKPRSPEARAKVSAALAGRPARNKGEAQSSAHRAKISAALLGRDLSPEHRENIASAMRGKPKSAEHRAKLSAANQGRPLSAEHREKISSGNRGRPVSAETRAKISRANRKERDGSSS